MQREFTAIPSNWSVGQTIDYLRESKDLPEEFLEIFIIDNNFKPIGTVPSSKVLRTARESKMNSIMNEMQVLIPVTMDKEEVGHNFENYNLVSIETSNKKFKDIFNKNEIKYQYKLFDLMLVSKPDTYKLQLYKKNNYDIVVVSASLQCWLLPWCQKNSISLISTKLEFKKSPFKEYAFCLFIGGYIALDPILLLFKYLIKPSLS